MSNRLWLDQQLPEKYDRQAVARIIRALCTQINLVSENRLTGTYNAQNSVPTAGSVAYLQGDFVRNTAASVAGTVGSQYIILGWVCTVSGTPGTFQEVRILTGT